MTLIRTAAALLLLLLATGAAAGEIDFDSMDHGSATQRIEAYELLLKQGETNPELLFRLGNALYDDGRLDEAADRFRGSWESTGDLRSLVNLSIVLEQLDHRDEAGKIFNEAIDKNPGDPVLISYYGDFLSASPDTNSGIGEAVMQYRRALYIDENCLEAHFGLGTLFARVGIIQEAIREWDLVRAIDSKHALAETAEKNLIRAHRKMEGR